jgi:hypothetical protein
LIGVYHLVSLFVLNKMNVKLKKKGMKVFIYF